MESNQNLRLQMALCEKMRLNNVRFFDVNRGRLWRSAETKDREKKTFTSEM